jgi:hypothetical protein
LSASGRRRAATVVEGVTVAVVLIVAVVVIVAVVRHRGWIGNSDIDVII